jgi:hypothetical protein
MWELVCACLFAQIQQDPGITHWETMASSLRNDRKKNRPFILGGRSYKDFALVRSTTSYVGSTTTPLAFLLPRIPRRRRSRKATEQRAQHWQEFFKERCTKSCCWRDHRSRHRAHPTSADTTRREKVRGEPEPVGVPGKLSVPPDGVRPESGVVVGEEGEYGNIGEPADELA